MYVYAQHDSVRATARARARRMHAGVVRRFPSSAWGVYLPIHGAFAASFRSYTSETLEVR